MDLGITEDAQGERQMSTLSIFPLLKVMNLLMGLNFFEGAQGAQHSHWGSGVITFSGTSSYWDQLRPVGDLATPYDPASLPISAYVHPRTAGHLQAAG